MNKPLAISMIILGLLFIAVSFIYFLTPANALPGFLPGHQAVLTTHHYKHGVGSLLLGIACFIFVWFQSGKKRLVKEEKNG
ncbi:MAG TPA: hypothetical protein VNW29_05855 [Candidatus Sulfotelmatobacter sp.]|nr:hypothetical protein [Candidatus Sulfotelmatobacter sp.]